MQRRFCLLSLMILLAGTAWGADVTGRWKVKITTADGQIEGVASFTQNGNRVTGWLGPSEDDPIAISVRVDGERLAIETHPQPGRNVAFAKCEVTVHGDRMTGTIDGDKGTIEFSRDEPAKRGP